MTTHDTQDTRGTQHTHDTRPGHEWRDGDDVRAIIARAVDAAHDGADAHLLLARYWRHVPHDDLAGMDPVDVAGAALSHRQLAAHRAPGSANVRVFTPTVDEHGWSSGHTVVEVVSDDMPFLVDSVTAELSRQDRSLHLVVHPQFVVRRSPAGELLEALDINAATTAVGQHQADWPADAVPESWIHLEIDRETSTADVQLVTEGLRRVLDDVRAAVNDWSRMRDKASGVAEQLVAAPPPGVDEAEVAEAARLLRWLADNHFTFLGYREYELRLEDGDDCLRAVAGSGLGILRHDTTKGGSASFGRLPPAARGQARDARVLVLTKANSRSTVHRPAYLDYVGVKVFDDAGTVVGERRFLGLFTSAAYVQSVRSVPVIDRKVAEVLQRAGFSPDSHSGKDLLQILETYPRDELFQTATDDLHTTTTAVLHLQERRRTRLFLRRDDYGRFMSCLVYLPRDRYTTSVRLRMEEILRDAFGGESVDYTTRVSESVLARLHFVIRVARGASLAEVDVEQLERRLVEATRTWDEDLADALRGDAGEEEAARLLRTWARGFPEAYKEDFSPRVAVADLRRIEQLETPADDSGEGGALGLNLYEPVGAAPEERRFKLYRRAPLSLTTVLPFLANLGVEVVDERPYALDGAQGRAWVYDFGLRVRPSIAADAEADAGRVRFSEAFAAAWAGRSESDGLDQLVLGAGLGWRQVVVLRMYTKYLRQTGSTYSQSYVEDALVAQSAITRLLVRLFEARFDPDAFGGAGADDEGRTETVRAIVEEVEGALEDVASLDHDRILRSLLGCVLATLRTNAFQRDAGGAYKPSMSVKLDPGMVPQLPSPRPAFEVFVYSPRVEGVHLRFGRVARGGLRWSDRREDFRTEVLGLVKAQMVKNAVIVPTGAKGGFVCKRLPDPAVDRDAWLAEGTACYRTFVSALLDITDNLVPGERGDRVVVPPARVVRHDGDDTYLVVAADKGTATFSDIANAVAADYGFWLGDAFASGGSAGYDHKAMGITARGAWESVRRHFRDLGVDVQEQDVTVVGVGDMSGDVFGNGMLLSRHLRLLAAFDHRHIFLDPDPDAATSYAERQRLFALPRSSWADYDATLISDGGGVYPRTAKSVPLSAAVARALELPDTPGQRLTPAELMRAVLAAPVDLLWNGGIGTYVKASTESHTDVGDKANDAIRVNGSDLRARVVGEGGNLGLTQRGRIEAALHGVRLHTDAIDNSAGVDCSDHEVNIKILLDRVVADGDLTGKQRNSLLVDMTDDVAALVLRDNYAQNVLLGNGRSQAHPMAPVHLRFMRVLAGSGELDRELEFLPDDAEMARRIDDGTGLTTPEFSVLVAYSKMSLARQVLATDLPDDPACEPLLRGYFPTQLVERYGDRLAAHPLRREIVTNVLVNDLVNRGGITFAFRAGEETGASAEQVVRAYLFCRKVFALDAYFGAVEAVDATVPASAQVALYLEFRRLLDRATRWVLQNRPARLDVDAEVSRFAPTVAELGPRIPELLVGAERASLVSRTEELQRKGAPPELAVRAAALLHQFSLLDITLVAENGGRPAADVVEVYLTLSERYGMDAMLTRITALPRGDRWQALARAALRYDLYATLEGLTTVVLQASDEGPPLARIAAWEQANLDTLTRANAVVEEVSRLERSDLASLSVALRMLRSVVQTSV